MCAADISHGPAVGFVGQPRTACLGRVREWELESLAHF